MPNDFTLYGSESTNMGTTTGPGIFGDNSAMIFDGVSAYREFGTTVK